MLDNYKSRLRLSSLRLPDVCKHSVRAVGTALTVAALVACNASDSSVSAEKNVVKDGKVTTDMVFAPHQGLVAEIEKPYRDEVSLNGSWQFQPIALPKGWKKDQGQAPKLTEAKADKWDATPIRIPSPWNVNAFQEGQGLGKGPDYKSFPSYPESWGKAKMGWLKREFTVPAGWDGKTLKLHFEAVAGDAVVLVNGKEVARNFDPFLPFEADVTNAVDLNKPNEILVGVRAVTLFRDTRTKAGRRTWPGGSFWGKHIAGIWQDVSLQAHDPVHVSDVFVKPLVDKDTLEVNVTLTNNTDKAVTVAAAANVSPWSHNQGTGMLQAPVADWILGATVLDLGSNTEKLAAGKSKVVTFKTKVGGKLKLWTGDTPNLYGLQVAVTQNGKQVDNKYERFGWRQWTLKGQDYFLNGEKVQFKGDSWHFTGIPMMTRRYAWAWFSAIKASNGNAVRPHAQIYPRFYLEMADEMGIFVLHENSIWASDGGHKFDSELFWQRSEDHTRRWVMRDRNHASVFGWSISNENWPIIEYQIRDKKIMERQNKEWHVWANIVNELDGTRPWISADGDKYAAGATTALINHYGDEANMKQLASKGMPWGIGEQGMAYYGTPSQVASVNGGRSFESVEGRMEGIAYEAYRLIELNEKYNAAYSSVFNLAWYALKPLPFGHADVTEAPSVNAGVYFSNYQENSWGVQPEKIGAYSSTFNPGYDKNFDVYQTWPMFDAIKAANGNDPELAKKWAKYPGQGESILLKAPTTAKSKLASSNVNKFKEVAAEVGIAVDAKSTQNLIIDGTNAPANAAEVKAQVDAILANGGSVVVYNPTPESLAKLNAVLPAALEINESDSCSWVIENETHASNTLTNNDLYFCEVQSKSIMDYGLGGDLVAKSNVLWRKAEADWRMWNKRSEATKTGMLYRSELERKGFPAALVEYKGAKGSLYVLSSSQLTDSSLGQGLLEKLMLNVGVELSNSRDPAKAKAFNSEAQLKNVLALGTFAMNNPTQDHIKTDGDAPQIYVKDAGKTWMPYKSNGEGVFNFRPTSLKGPQSNAAVYLSFSIYSPRSLDNVLEEPDMPQLDMVYGSDDGHKIWLNNKLLVNKEKRMGAHIKNEFKVSALPLQAGWNHMLVKVTQGGGDWKFSAKLKSNNQDYLNKVDSAISRSKDAFQNSLDVE